MKTVDHTINGEAHSNLRLGEHEILLSFRNDIGAEAFYYFWTDDGADLFVEWCERDETFKVAIDER